MRRESSVRGIRTVHIKVTVLKAAITLVEHIERNRLVLFKATTALSSIALASSGVPYSARHRFLLLGVGKALRLSSIGLKTRLCTEPALPFSLLWLQPGIGASRMNLTDGSASVSSPW